MLSAACAQISAKPISRELAGPRPGRSVSRRLSGQVTADRQRRSRDPKHPQLAIDSSYGVISQSTPQPKPKQSPSAPKAVVP
jgi:hypothetical protein